MMSECRGPSIGAHPPTIRGFLNRVVRAGTSGQVVRLTGLCLAAVWQAGAAPEAPQKSLGADHQVISRILRDWEARRQPPEQGRIEYVEYFDMEFLPTTRDELVASFQELDFSDASGSLLLLQSQLKGKTIPNPPPRWPSRTFTMRGEDTREQFGDRVQLLVEKKDIVIEPQGSGRQVTLGFLENQPRPRFASYADFSAIPRQFLLPEALKVLKEEAGQLTVGPASADSTESLRRDGGLELIVDNETSEVLQMTHWLPGGTVHSDLYTVRYRDGAGQRFLPDATVEAQYQNGLLQILKVRVLTRVDFESPVDASLFAVPVQAGDVVVDNGLNHQQVRSIKGAAENLLAQSVDKEEFVAGNRGRFFWVLMVVQAAFLAILAFLAVRWIRNSRRTN